MTISDDGTIRIEGSENGWRYDVTPVDPLPGIMPWISNGIFPEEDFK